MKKLTLAASIAIAVLAATPVLAGGTTSPGASGNTPAEQMKKHDSQGASKYTPGHKMQDATRSMRPAPPSMLQVNNPRIRVVIAAQPARARGRVETTNVMRWRLPRFRVGSLTLSGSLSCASRMPALGHSGRDRCYLRRPLQLSGADVDEPALRSPLWPTAHAGGAGGLSSEGHHQKKSD
jgi:hypothetical protein